LWLHGEELLKQARAKVVFKYHNVTPAEFFPKSSKLYYCCAEGRLQTSRLMDLLPQSIWLSDSEYNSTDVLDKMRSRIVPPFLGLRKTTGRPEIPSVEKPTCRVLMVARFASNKGHIFALRVTERYLERYGPEIVLTIVGRTDVQPYYHQVVTMVEERKLTQHCQILGGEVSASYLAWLFATSTAYLCCSEHEGFCVPLVEAQMFNLAVVARQSTAIPETIGPNQLVFGDNIEDYVEALYRLAHDWAYRQSFVKTGRKNYERRFARTVVERLFLESVREVVPNL